MAEDQRVSARVKWYQRASIWLGIGINPASISAGGGLATQLPFSDLIWVLPLGVFLLSLLCTGQSLIGYRRSQRLSQIAGRTFGGGMGAGCLNLMMAIGMVGWSGFQGGVSGASAAQLLNAPDWLGALVVAVSLYILSAFGINRWAVLTWLTTGSAIALTLFALLAVDLTPRFSAETAPGMGFALLVPRLWSLGTIISYAVLFSLRSPDFTWDMASRKDVIKANLFLFFPLLFSMGAGAILYRATGNWNIADVLKEAQLAFLGHIFLIVAVISPLVSGWYSGALALSSLTSLQAHRGTMLICASGFVLAATRFDQLLLPFLGGLGASLAPALVTILLVSFLPQRPHPLFALAAWFTGAVVATLFQLQGHSFHIFAGALASALVLFGLQLTLGRTAESLVRR